MSGQHHALATLLLPKNPTTQWTGGWVGPRATLGVSEIRKLVAAAGIWTSDHPACSLVSLFPTVVNENTNTLVYFSIFSSARFFYKKVFTRYNMKLPHGERMQKIILRHSSVGSWSCYPTFWGQALPPSSGSDIMHKVSVSCIYTCRCTHKQIPRDEHTHQANHLNYNIII
jgi:hypothetical protein